MCPPAVTTAGGHTAQHGGGGTPTFPFQGGGGPGGVVFNQFLLELTIRKDDFIRLFLGGGGVWGEWL
jgi:hypothetical protein